MQLKTEINEKVENVDCCIGEKLEMTQCDIARTLTSRCMKTHHHLRGAFGWQGLNTSPLLGPTMPNGI